MPQHERARLLAGARLDLARDGVRDATHPTCLPRQRLADDPLLAVGEAGALGDHHDAEAPADRVPGADLLAHDVHRPVDLGDQDHVGRAGHARVQRDEARVPPHDLE
ncbi:hypothetical protein RZS08_00530, partial [Arthrospira platensis SPKY1]|nr:hypothetical protein [Arthrospira platensis SPKY1]